MSDELLVVSQTEQLVVEGISAYEVIDVTQPAVILEVAQQGPPGSPGLQGVAGPTGLQGPAGPASDLNFQYAQSPASTSWLITHNLGKFPSVTVVDSAGEQVEGSVEFIGINSLRVTFSAAFTGSAYLN